MSKDEWEEFIGTKKRTTQTHYSQGRKCEVCDRYITNNNKTGKCPSCRWSDYKSKGSGSEDHKLKGSESEAHKQLKVKAIKWLQEQGGTKIKEEKHLRQQRIRADVIGVLNKEQVIIECGGSQKRKLGKLLKAGYKVLIWPYSFKKPYKYDPEYQVCNRCGNRIDCQV